MDRLRKRSPPGIIEQMFEPDAQPSDGSTEPVDPAVVLRVAAADGVLDVSATLAALLSAPPSGAVLDLAAELAGRGDLTARQLIDLALLGDRCAAWTEAAVLTRTFAALDRVAGPGERIDPNDPDRRDQLVTETALALRWSPSMVGSRLANATTLTARLPGTLALLAGGLISPRHAAAMATGADLLDDPRDADKTAEQTAKLEDRVLGKAPTQTRAELARAVARAVTAIDPDGAERRRQAVRADRRVERYRDIDQAGVLKASGPAEKLEMIWSALSLGADQLKATGQVDTLAQGRFDTLSAWACAYLGQAHVPSRTGQPVGVQLVVKHSTLRGADDDPAELVGFGPVTARTARELAFGLAPAPGPFEARTAEERERWAWQTPPEDVAADEAPPPPPDPLDVHGPRAPDGYENWPTPDPATQPATPHGPPDRVSVRQITVDPATGHALPPEGLRLGYGRTRRHFPEALAAYIRDRYRRCAFPGCAMPLHTLDTDHGRPWSADGSTDATNAFPMCPHHNRTTKTGGAWTITPTGDGTATLTTPHGRTYLIEPHNYLD